MQCLADAWLIKCWGINRAIEFPQHPSRTLWRIQYKSEYDLFTYCKKKEEPYSIYYNNILELQTWYMWLVHLAHGMLSCVFSQWCHRLSIVVRPEIYSLWHQMWIQTRFELNDSFLPESGVTARIWKEAQGNPEFHLTTRVVCHENEARKGTQIKKDNIAFKK